MARRNKHNGNGKSKKQPKVGRMACREKSNKYGDYSKFPHDAYGIRKD